MKLLTPLVAVATCVAMTVPSAARAESSNAITITPLAARADPELYATPRGTHIVTMRAEGAQIYECKMGAAGNLVWQSREPIATLLWDGATVGRHYAGPSWELQDGSLVTAKVAERFPGATDRDIPLLKLDVTSHRGSGQLADVTTILRFNTLGGLATGPCPSAGKLISVPYAADYGFFKHDR
jgi:hypothetical protein